MMKSKRLALIILLIGMIFMSSCGKSGKKLFVEEIDFSDLMFEDQGVYDGDIVKNEEIALQYAHLILEKGLERSITEYKQTSIFFDPEREIWVISFLLGQDYVGGDISVAISKKTGEVIKVWAGE